MIFCLDKAAHHKPSLEGQKLGVIPFEEVVIVLNEIKKEITIGTIKGKWCKINWNGKIGWVFDGYLVDFNNIKDTNENKISNSITDDSIGYNNDINFPEKIIDSKTFYILGKDDGYEVVFQLKKIELKNIRRSEPEVDLNIKYFYYKTKFYYIEKNNKKIEINDWFYGRPIPKKDLFIFKNKILIVGLRIFDPESKKYYDEITNFRSKELWSEKISAFSIPALQSSGRFLYTAISPENTMFVNFSDSDSYDKGRKKFKNTGNYIIKRNDSIGLIGLNEYKSIHTLIQLKKIYQNNDIQPNDKIRFLSFGKIGNFDEQTHEILWGIITNNNIIKILFFVGLDDRQKNCIFNLEDLNIVDQNLIINSLCHTIIYKKNTDKSEKLFRYDLVTKENKEVFSANKINNFIFNDDNRLKIDFNNRKEILNLSLKIKKLDYYVIP